MGATAIKLILVAFLSLLAFSVGSFVGKQFADSQKRIAKVERNQYYEKKECKCP